MPDIVAIVFDTNVFGKSVLPKVDLVEQWANACADHDAELWLPEVVVWELAQRILEQHHQTISTLAQLNSSLNRAGLPVIPTPADICENDVRDALETAGAVVIPTDPGAAVAAIKDQVLQRGPAERKKGVKTGAADSAWVRSVLLYNNGSADGLIVVTGDKTAVTTTCEAADIEPPQIAGGIYQLRLLLGPASEASASQVQVFLSAAEELFGPGASSNLTELAGLSRRDQWWEVLEVDTWEYQDSYVSVTEKPTVESVIFDAWSSSLSGRLRIPVFVEEAYARQDYLGDAPEYLYHTYEGWVDGDFTVYIHLDLDGGQQEICALAVSDLEDVDLGVVPNSEEFDEHY